MTGRSRKFDLAACPVTRNLFQTKVSVAKFEYLQDGLAVVVRATLLLAFNTFHYVEPGGPLKPKHPKKA